MDCIYYSFLNWLLEIGDDGERHHAAAGGLSVAAMFYVGSFTALLSRVGFVVPNHIYPMLIGAGAMLILTFFRYIDEDKFRTGLSAYRAADHGGLCRKSYWIILLSPVAVAVSIYIKYRT
jgi:hypothetical protein